MLYADQISYRRAVDADSNFLKEMLYEAIFISEGEEKPPFSVLEEPDIKKYYDQWMRPADAGLIAEAAGAAVGAAWARKFDSAAEGAYGFISPDIPELAIAIKPQFRNRCIGRVMMDMLFCELTGLGFQNLSLSVDKRNRAVNFYLSLGFTIFKEQNTDFLMVIELGPSKGSLGRLGKPL